MKKKILSLLLAVVMALSLVPTSVLAAPDDLGQVRVIVENTTFTEPVNGKAPAWTGTLVDSWVKLTEKSTMMSCVVKALEAKGYTQTGAENNYISDINGLAAFDGGGQSGWMGTLNDWFANEGFGAFTVAAGKLEGGDEIRVMYSRSYGDDLGGSFGSSDNTVKALSFSAGELSPAFGKDTHSYTLKLAADVSSVVVTPTASNKNFQVRTSVDGTEYKRTAEIPVADGTVITVKCGDPSWPSMNQAEKAEEYTITVEQAAPAAVKVTIRSQAAGSYLHAPQEVEVSALDAEKYGFTDALEGVSALDALVKAHELVIGKDFTKETAGEYLAVGSTGWISKIFGTDTMASGFYINGGYPNDGTPASYGGGYNGTMVTNTPLLSGDVVDFYVMSDGTTYSDYYTWVDAPAEMQVGKKVTATVTGFYAMSGYLYKDPASLKAAAKPLEGAKLGWMNPETGAVTVIDGAVTDEKGQATFTVTNGFTGYLTAVSNTDNEDEEVYVLLNPTAKVKEIPVVTVDLTGLHSAQLASLKLYSYAGGVKGDVDLLAGKSTVADGYKLKYADVKLPAGNYWVQGYNEAGQYNGGIVVTVAEDTTSIAFSRTYGIYASNSGWVENTDYTIDYQVVGADGMNRKAEMGTSTSWGNTRTSGIFVQGDTVKATLTPIGDKAADYVAATVSKTGTQTESAIELYAAIPTATSITVNAPKGSTISAGIFRTYWTYEFVEAASVTENADGVSATFTLPVLPTDSYLNYNNHFVRVQHPDGVTYWTFDKWNTQQTIDVTREDLHIGDSEYTKTTVNGFDKNLYDLGNVYLTVNQKGYKNLEVGQSFDLQVFRNWQAIEHYMNTKIALPDVHYRVIDVNGSDSDILTISTDANNSGIASVTANKNGTAIVLVTYDAMTHAQGMGGTELSAIWPEFTGVLVVSVGADGTAIETNAVMDRLGAKTTPLDAEHDILYYFDNRGASYSFRPEEGCTVTVARSTVTDKMTFSGFTSKGVTVAADGTVTVTGLTTGRHILCVEKDGVKTYQVVTARGVSYDFLDADGNTLPKTTEFKAGDKVKIQFHGLVNPAEKLAGIYNRTPIINLVGEDSTKFVSGQAGWAGTYDFNGNPARQAITVTIPDNWTELSYSLNGAIVAGQAFGQATGAHRAARYGVGTGTYTETKVGDVLSQIPALSLKLEGWHVNDAIEKIDAIGQVTLASKDAITAARTAYEALTEAQQAQVKNYDKLTSAEAVYTRLLAEQSERLQMIYKTTGDFMGTLGTPTVNSTGGEWMVIGLARSGRTVPAGYYDNVVEYVKAKADANERLHPTKVTDNARVILALTAIGKDVTNVGGHNLLKGLDNMAYVQTQGINGPIFTLIALDSHNYPTMGDVTREKLIETILGAALEDGGWTLSGTKADPDMTAMAIQALAPYYKTNETVKAAVDKALDVLSGLQQGDGGFGSWGTVNSESCAQVIVALTALGIDPTADSRFVKNGLTVLDALAGFYVTGGGFRHTAGGERNGMATEQGYYALAAYYRFVNAQTRLYDMSDVTIQTGGSNTPATGDTGVLVWVIALPVTILAAAFVLKRKEREA